MRRSLIFRRQPKAVVAVDHEALDAFQGFNVKARIDRSFDFPMRGDDQSRDARGKVISHAAWFEATRLRHVDDAVDRQRVMQRLAVMRAIAFFAATPELGAQWELERPILARKEQQLLAGHSLRRDVDPAPLPAHVYRSLFRWLDNSRWAMEPQLAARFADLFVDEVNWANGADVPMPTSLQVPAHDMSMGLS